VSDSDDDDDDDSKEKEGDDEWWLVKQFKKHPLDGNKAWLGEKLPPSKETLPKA